MTEQAPRKITQRELCNDSGAIMRAVERGESFTITRNGTPIGRLIPLRRRTFVPRQEAMAAFAAAPILDAEKFRADIDDLADQNLSVVRRAAAEQAAIAEGLAAVAELEAEDGALTDAERAKARQALIDAGVIRPDR